MTRQLFTVEFEDGEMIDDSGDGGYTVWTDRPNAQDSLDSHLASHPEDAPLRVVTFERVNE